MSPWIDNEREIDEMNKGVRFHFSISLISFFVISVKLILYKFFFSTFSSFQLNMTFMLEKKDNVFVSCWKSVNILSKSNNMYFFVFKDNIKISLEIFHSQLSKITGECLCA